MPEIGPGRNFFGRQPGPFPIGPGLQATPEFPSQTGFLSISLVRRPRTIGTKVSFDLRPPQAPSTPPLVAGPLGGLALQVPKRGVRSRLSPPAVVTAATTPPVITKPLVKLARTPNAGRGQGYGLAAPAVVQVDPLPPVETHLAQRRRRVRTISILGGPAVISTTATSPAVETRLRVYRAKWRRPRPTVHQLHAGLVAAASAVVAHDCRKTLFTDATQTFGSLTLATGGQGSLTLSAGSSGTLSESADGRGGLTESASTRGDLTDTC